jgi:hypothetical protein
MTASVYRFYNRRDTSYGWTTKNPILGAGEIGFETDTRIFKIGDGVTYWINLPYQNTQGPKGATGSVGPKGTFPVFTFQGNLQPYVGATRLYFEEAHSIVGVRATLGTPSTGAPVVMAAYINGVLLGSVSVPAGQNTATISVSKQVSSGDYATISVLSVGSTQTGADLVATLNVI